MYFSFSDQIAASHVVDESNYIVLSGPLYEVENNTYETTKNFRKIEVYPDETYDQLNQNR